MRVPLSWLKEFVEITIPVEELVYRLTMAGLEVSDVHHIGGAGSALHWDPDKIVIANILEVMPHPNADRLVLADVDYGATHPHRVVTGAPNLFPYSGKGHLPHPLKAVFAKEGSKIYDGHQPGNVITTLKGRPVRGVMSDAMLCSEKELGISDNHEGIIILEDDAPVGVPARDFLGEVILNIDLTPNLARCLSIVGVAREVAAITGAPLHIPEPAVHMEGPPIEQCARVTVAEPLLCPRFTVGLIEGITVRPSPAWMQRRLRHAGMRPINNIVDISNYVMLEWGEPTHAFDADKVQDCHLIARLATPGERLRTLDGKDRNFTPETATQLPPLLVCDPSGPLGIAGVMGGEESEVSATTTRVLLEAAIWEPSQIRRTAQRSKIPSEASRRFERGVDINVAIQAQHRALELMRTLAGGTVAQGLIDVLSAPWDAPTLNLSPREVARILGIHLSAFEITDILLSLGFACNVNSTTTVGDFADYGHHMNFDTSVVQVRVPSYRQDVTCLADLCEEIARIYGYDKIPSTRLPEELPIADEHPDLDIEQRIRNLLIGCGLNNVITYSLTNMQSVAKLSPSEANPERYLRITNSTTPEREYLQRSLLPTLLEAMAANLYERERVCMFEIGRVFFPKPQPPVGSPHEAWLPKEPRYLALAMAGPRSPLSWHTNASDRQPMDFFDVKGIIETVLSRLMVRDLATFVPLTDDERFHPGRAAALCIQKPAKSDDCTDGKHGKRSKPEIVNEQVGVLGELHPEVCERFAFRSPRVVVAELNLEQLFDLVRSPTYTAVSRYPATIQDLAIVVKQDVPVEQVTMLIKRGAGDLLESLTLFDVYTGSPVGEGKRSLTYRLSFRALDRTLNDEALAKVRAKIIKGLEREIGATIRE